MRARRLAPLLVVMAVAAGAGASTTSMEVQLEPQRLGVEDTTRLVVTIHEPGRRSLTPNLGSLDNFQIVAGPSTENRFMLVNGTATTDLVVTYVLQPQSVGPARVGPISVQVGKETLRSAVLAAEVVAGSLVPRRPSRRSPFHDPFAEVMQPQRPSAQAKILLRQLVSEREIFLGETLTVSLVLDSNIAGIEGFEWVEAPLFPGWWTQPVEQPEEVRPEIVEFSGERFQRYILGQFVLVPLKAGELALPEAKVRVGVRQRGFFSRQQVVERSAAEVKVEVLDRPPPPEGFSGAVGDLRYSISLEPSILELGEPAVVTITLDGSGNLPLVEAPSTWPSCVDCDTYPPEDEADLKVTPQGMRGHRRWQQTILPRSAGELRLEPISLAVFDPTSGHYRRQSLGPLTLEVTPPPPPPTPTLTAEQMEAIEAGAPGEVGASEPVTGGRAPAHLWVWLLATLLVGAVGGGTVVWLVLRRQTRVLPPRRSGQNPSERAKDLQMALERWWLEARHSTAADTLVGDLDQLRRDLESVRFAPGRADHTETIRQLEDRAGQLVRRASRAS